MGVSISIKPTYLYLQANKDDSSGRQTVTTNSPSGPRLEPQDGGLIPPPAWAAPQRTEVMQRWVDFTGRRSYLDSPPCDVLFLLDCYYASAAAIGAGQELIAAHAAQTDSPRTPGHFPFTEAMIHELEQAYSSGKYLTTALLYGNLLQKSLDGSLERIPIHAELSHLSRKSIFILPQPPTLAGPLSSKLRPDDIPLFVSLHAQLGHASSRIGEELATWFAQTKPSWVEKVNIRDSWKSSS